MKKKYSMLLLLIQVTLVSITNGQTVGIGTSSVPLSTLDIGGTMGIRLVKNIGTAQTPTEIENSTVLYTATNGSVTVTLPVASSTNLGRMYIIGYAIGNKTDMTVTSYYNLNNTPTTLITKLQSIIVICDGKNWLQIL